jgi:hypothetical protein
MPRQGFNPPFDRAHVDERATFDLIIMRADVAEEHDAAVVDPRMINSGPKIGASNQIESNDRAIHLKAGGGEPPHNACFRRNPIRYRDGLTPMLSL